MSKRWCGSSQIIRKSAAYKTVKTLIREELTSMRRKRLPRTFGVARDKAIENERWWYIPSRWIGAAGFVVTTDVRYVNLAQSSSTDQFFIDLSRSSV